MRNYLTAEKARKKTKKAAAKARDNYYHQIISCIENCIETRIDDGEYTYHTSFDRRLQMDDHMVDCLRKHFRACGFLVEIKFVENNNGLDYYDFSISWDV